MDWLTIVALTVAISLALFLTVALLLPERLS